MTTLRFPKAIGNFRPYKSHRYDVFGLKVNRALVLFTSPALNTWLQLEADPLVLSYCERPVIIPDTAPKRIVDFWVAYPDREELWLLQSGKASTHTDEPKGTLQAFSAWATSQRLSIRHVRPINGTDSRYFLDNWGRIVRTLSANRRYLTPPLVKRILNCMGEPHSLLSLMQSFPDEDPVLVQTAAFSLIHTGRLRCVDIDTQPLGTASMLMAT